MKIFNSIFSHLIGGATLRDTQGLFVLLHSGIPPSGACKTILNARDQTQVNCEQGKLPIYFTILQPPLYILKIN